MRMLVFTKNKLSVLAEKVPSLIKVSKYSRSTMAFVTLLLCQTFASASTLEQAKQLHDRLTGVPASATTLTDMVSLLDNNKAIEAAYKAMENSAFYTTKLKLFATPWTNEEEDILNNR